MIKSVRIKNFQSHKDSSFEFHSNVNIISGSSNNGKSVVIRALNWAIKNKAPSSICSNWNIDKKGNQIDNIEVEVITEKGKCVRIKGKKNGYTLNGSEYNAIGRDIPEQVKEFFNMTDTNIQSQMDSPFLLSLNGPDATKFINKVVKLESIDTILSKAEKDRRSVNSELKVIEKDISDCQNKIEGLKWVESAESVLKKMDIYESKIDDLTEEADKLNESIELYRQKENDTFDIDLELLANHIREEMNILNDLNVKYVKLKDSIDSFKKYKVYDFSKIDKVLNEIKIVEDSIDSAEALKLANNINIVKSYTQGIESLNKEIEELKKGFPEVCPFCGAKMEGDLCAK